MQVFYRREPGLKQDERKIPIQNECEVWIGGEGEGDARESEEGILWPMKESRLSHLSR